MTDKTDALCDVLGLCESCREQIKNRMRRTQTTLEDWFRDAIWGEVGTWPHARSGCPVQIPVEPQPAVPAKGSQEKYHVRRHHGS